MRPGPEIFQSRGVAGGAGGLLPIFGHLARAAQGWFDMALALFVLFGNLRVLIRTTSMEGSVKSLWNI